MGALNCFPEITAHNFKLLNEEERKNKGKAANDSGDGKPLFKLRSADDVCNAPPLRWLVRGVMPDKGVATWYGPSGSGKSFLIFDFAAAVAGDAEFWFGRRLNHAPVTYVCLEGEAGLGKRVQAWRKLNGKPIPDTLKFITQPFDLLSTDLEALAKVIIDGGGANGVTVIDTLNRATPGCDENSSSDMSKIIAAASELQRLIGGLVILVSHTGKDTSKGLRGHSSLYAALDAAIEIKVSGNQREWVIAKSKDDSMGDSFPFKLEIVSLGVDEFGDEITSCVACPADANGSIFNNKQASLSGNQKIIFEALKAIFNQSSQGADTEVVTGLSLDDAIERTRVKLVCDSKRQTERAKAAISALVAKGLLRFHDDWIYPT